MYSFSVNRRQKTTERKGKYFSYSSRTKSKGWAREHVYKHYCLFPVVWCLWGCKSLYGFYPQLLLIEINTPSDSPLILLCYLGRSKRRFFHYVPISEAFVPFRKKKLKDTIINVLCLFWVLCTLHSMNHTISFIACQGQEKRRRMIMEAKVRLWTVTP